MDTTTAPIYAYVYSPELEDLTTRDPGPYGDLVDVSTWSLARKRQLREEAAVGGDDSLVAALDANIAAEEAGMTLAQLLDAQG